MQFLYFNQIQFILLFLALTAVFLHVFHDWLKVLVGYYNFDNIVGNFFIGFNFLGILTICFFNYLVLFFYNSSTTFQQISLQFAGGMVFDSLGKAMGFFLVFFFIICFMIFLLGSLKVSVFELTERLVLLLILFYSWFIMLYANNFLFAFLLLELQALLSYVFISRTLFFELNYDVVIKYLVANTLATVVFLYGVVGLYSLVGSVDFFDLLHYSRILFISELQSIKLLFSIFCFLIIISLVVKLGLAPFHAWMVDVYGVLPNFILPIFLVLPKFVLLVFLFRLYVFVLSPFFFIFSIPVFDEVSGLLFYFSSFSIYWVIFLLAVGTCSVFIGSLGVIFRSQLGSFFVYSSILNFGFIFIALAGSNLFSFKIAAIYLIIYSMVVLGFFMCLMVLQFFVFFPKNFVSAKLQQDAVLVSFGFNDLLFLSRFSTNFSMVLLALLFLVSLAGLPPFAGFFVKLLVFYSFMMSGQVVFVVLFAFLNVIGIFAYLRFISQLGFEIGNFRFFYFFFVNLSGILFENNYIIRGLFFIFFFTYFFFLGILLNINLFFFFYLEAIFEFFDFLNIFFYF